MLSPITLRTNHRQKMIVQVKPVIDALWFIIPAAKHLLMICYASSHHILNMSRAFRDRIKLKRICKKHVKSWTHLVPSEITICFAVLSKQRSVTPLSMFDANLQCETLQLWNVAKKSGTGVDCFEHLKRSWKVWWSLEKVASPHTDGDKQGQGMKK
jgi:hypothetical protein